MYNNYSLKNTKKIRCLSKVICGKKVSLILKCLLLMDSLSDTKFARERVVIAKIFKKVNCVRDISNVKVSKRAGLKFLDQLYNYNYV